MELPHEDLDGFAAALAREKEFGDGVEQLDRVGVPFLVLGKEISQKFHLAGRDRFDGLELLLGRIRVRCRLDQRAGALGGPRRDRRAGAQAELRALVFAPSGWLLLAHPSGGLPLVARAVARRITREVERPALLPALLVPVEMGFQGGMDHLHFDHHPAEDFFLRSERAGSGERICHSGVLPVVLDENVAGLGRVPGSVGGDSVPWLSGGRIVQPEGRCGLTGPGRIDADGVVPVAKANGDGRAAWLSLKTCCR